MGVINIRGTQGYWIPEETAKNERHFDKHTQINTTDIITVNRSETIMRQQANKFCTRTDRNMGRHRGKKLDACKRWCYRPKLTWNTNFEVFAAVTIQVEFLRAVAPRGGEIGYQHTASQPWRPGLEFK